MGAGVRVRGGRGRELSGGPRSSRAIRGVGALFISPKSLSAFSLRDAASFSDGSARKSGKAGRGAGMGASGA